MKVWNYSNDKLFMTLELEDETSMFDSNPTKYWCYGNDCFMAKYKIRIPRRLEEKPDLLDAFIERHSEDEGFYV